MKAQPMSAACSAGAHRLITFIRNMFRSAAARSPIAERWRAGRMVAALAAVAISTIAVDSQAQVLLTLTNIHSFSVYTNGQTPYAGLVQGSDGNFYGTTTYGGTNGGFGTVFKVTPGGSMTSIHSFTGGSDGATPISGLIQGSDGNFYGTTYQGGADGLGTVFKISASGVLTTLYTFTGGGDGGDPFGALIQGSDGNLYGTSAGAGAAGNGTVFKITTGGVLTTLYIFTGGNDGQFPAAELIQASDGNFYGTTYDGGTNNGGTVFKISASGAFTSLYSFGAFPAINGDQPYGGLVQGSDGNLYGTTTYGGANDDGTVFKISPGGVLTSLYSFGGASDGSQPSAGLALGSDGFFYGTTYSGGANNLGTVFKISASGTLTSLYSFAEGNDGSGPYISTLVQGSDGSFYGTTAYGGANTVGTVFKITSGGAYASLNSFSGINDGVNPYAPLVQGSDGDFYGSVAAGTLNGFGGLYRMTASGLLSGLYSFVDSTDGDNNYGGLVQGSDGNFYGATAYNGPNSSGTVFKVTPSGTFAVLHAFTGGIDGGYPNGGLVQGSDGNFYGTTDAGGTNNNGTIFKISAGGAFTGLYSFTGNNDGANPYAGLVQGTDGNFYGTTAGGGTTGSGTVFKITASGTLTSLYAFTGGSDGGAPFGKLVQGSDGNFYGTAQVNGTGFGTVYQINLVGVLTTLFSFTGGSDGAYPNAGLVQGSDGNFYGTSQGGAGNHGTVFEIGSLGSYRNLYTFTGSYDGGSPSGGLIQGSDGDFYGITTVGGRGARGVVFKFSASCLQVLCPTDKTVACGTSWTFDQPIASSCCTNEFSTSSGPTNVLITPLNTVTNGTCPTVTVTQTWAITDGCGDSNTCSQVVTVTGCCSQTNCCTNCVAPYPDSYTVTILTGTNYIADDLCQGTNNLLEDVVTGVPNGIAVELWNETNQQITVDTFARGRWNNGTEPLTPGEGFILVNPGTNFTLTISGCLPGCPLPCQPPVGTSLLGGGGTNVVTSWSNLFSCPPPCGTAITLLNASNQESSTYVYGGGIWVPPLPVPLLGVGQSAFVTVSTNAGLTVACPTNKTVACGTTWTFDQPVATTCCTNEIAGPGGLTNVLVTPLGTVTNGVCPQVTITQTWAITDGCGDSNTCSQIVTVTGCCSTNTNCVLVINCPSNIVVTSCFNQQEFYNPTASNICCGVNGSVTCNPPSGSIFAVGTTTTVTCTATDCLQNTNFCTFTVTVLQGTNCATNCLQVQCPSNIVVTSCTNIQEFYTPTVTDSCCSNWTVVCTPPSGSYFAPNTTTVVDCFATDFCGMSNSCSFTVTVALGPNCSSNCIALTCPSNIVLTTCSNCAQAFYSATATNTCCHSNVVLNYSMPSGTCFPLGTNTVTVTAYDPDCASTPPVMCSFTVTVDQSTNCCSGPGMGLQSIQWLQLPTNTTRLLPNPTGANGGGTWIITNLPGYGNVLVVQNAPTNVIARCTNSDFGRIHAGGSFDNPPASYGNFDFMETGYGPYTWGVLPGSVELAYGFPYTGTGNSNLPPYQVSFYFLDGQPNPGSLVFATIGLSKFTTNTLSQPFTFRTEYDLLYDPINYPQGPSADTVLDGTYGSPLVPGVTGTVISSAYVFNGGDDYNTGYAILQPTNTLQTAFLPSGSGRDINNNTFPTSTNQAPYLTVTVNHYIYDIFSTTVGYLCCTNCPTNCLVLQGTTNKTVQCGTQWTFDTPTATSCCTNEFVGPDGTATNVLITPLGAVTNGSCPDPFAVTQTWSIVDACGNSNSWSQTVFIVGCCTNCLQVQCPSNKTVPCGSAWAFETPTATTCCTNYIDNPDGTVTNLIILPMSTVTNGSCPQVFMTQTWLITDACGNRTNCSQTVTITGCCTNCLQVDCPTNKTVSCGSGWTFDMPIASSCCLNNLGGTQTNVQITLTGTVTNGACPQLITANWQITDACGNSTNCSQTVTVQNTNSPVIIPGIVLDYATVPDAGISFAGGGFTFVGAGNGDQFEIDNVFNGAGDSIGFNGFFSSSGPFAIGPITISGPLQTAPVTGSGTLHISDGTHQHTGTVQWVDITTLGTSGVLNLNGLVNLTGIAYPGTSLDLQSLVTSGTAEVDLTFQFIPGQTLTQLATTGGFTDFSGTIVGSGVTNTPALINCASNKTVACGTSWSFDPPVSASACCTNLTITVLSTVSNVVSDPCAVIYTRTWEAVDCCSNAATCSQMITVMGCCTNCLTVDCPTNKTVACNSGWTFDLPTATTCCTNQFFIQTPAGDVLTNLSIISQGVTTNGACPQLQLTQTWLITDGCSNTATCSQTVTVTNCCNPPCLEVQCASNKLVACNSGWTFDLPIVTSCCSNEYVSSTGVATNVLITLLNTVTNGTCPNQTITANWTITDRCGDTTNCSQTVTITNCCNPPCLEVTCPTNKTVPCGTYWTFDLPIATSCCSNLYKGTGVLTNVLITPGIPVTNGTCPTVTVTQTWSIMDGCGDRTNCSQVVTITGCCTNNTNTGACCGPDAGPQTIQWLVLPSSPANALASNPSGSNSNGTWVIANLPCYGPVLITQNTRPNVEAGYFLNPAFDNAPNGNGLFEFTQFGYGPYNWGNVPGELSLYYNVQYTSNGVNAPLPAYEVNFYFLAGQPDICSLDLAVIGLGELTTNTLSQPMTFRTEYDITNTSPVSAYTEFSGDYEAALMAGVTGTVVDSAYDQTGSYGDWRNTGWAVFQPANTLQTASLPGGSGAGYPAPGTYPYLTVTINHQAGDGIDLTLGYICCTNCLTVDCPTNKSVACNSGWTFDVPSATTCCTNRFFIQTPAGDVLTNLSIVSQGVTTNGACPQLQLTQSWLITDGCSNTATCSQTVTVTNCCNPPCLDVQCPSNKLVACNSGWTFDLPIVTSCCSNEYVSSTGVATNVMITLLNTVTNGTCPNQTITANWTITDRCGDTTNCSQTVTVTNCCNPPCLEVTCPTNKTVPCGTYWTFDLPVATSCCSNLFKGTGVLTNVLITPGTPVTNGTCPTVTVTQTWSIMDGCGDRTNCSQVVTITGCCTNNTNTGACCGPDAGPQTIQWLVLPSSPANALASNPSGSNSNGTWVIANLPCYGPVLITQNTRPNVEAGYFLNPAFDNAPNGNGLFEFTQFGYGPYNWGNVPGELSLYYNVQYQSNGVNAPLPPYEVTFYFLAGQPDICSLDLAVIGLGELTTNTLSQPMTFRTEYDITNTSPVSAYTEFSGDYQGALMAGVTGTVVNSAYDATGMYGDWRNTGWAVFQPANTLQTTSLPSGSGAGYPAAGTYPYLTVTINHQAGDGIDLTLGYICCTNCLTVDCPTNKTVACGTAWTFDPPTATTCCSNKVVHIVSLGAVTNGTCPKFATNTWAVYDDCGNSNTCRQVVQIQDTTPPVITCPTNAVIMALDSNCDLVIPSISVSATDNCTPVCSLLFSQSPPGGTVVVGTNATVTVTVTDLCGNSNSCHVLVVGEPITPPIVTCPRTMTVSNCIVPCVPVTAQAICCSTAPTVVQSPPCGSSIGPGADTVTVTVTDCHGNVTTRSVYLNIVGGLGPVSFLSYLTNTGASTPSTSLSPALIADGAKDVPWSAIGMTTSNLCGAMPADYLGYPVAVSDICHSTGITSACGFASCPGQFQYFLWDLPSAASKWIAPSFFSNNGCDPCGLFTYSLQFTLPAGVTPSSATISGRFAVDDGVSAVQLNGHTLPPLPPGGFTHWTPFVITPNSYFVTGPNTLTFVVNYTSANPNTGLRVEFTNAYGSCQPCAPPTIQNITGSETLAVRLHGGGSIDMPSPAPRRHCRTSGITMALPWPATRHSR